MTLFARMLAIVLLLSTAALPMSATQQLGPGTSSSPAACHQHKSVPQPVSDPHLCCQVGHHSAVVQESISFTPLQAIAQAKLALPPANPIATVSLAPISSDLSPPPVLPLRI